MTQTRARPSPRPLHKPGGAGQISEAQLRDLQRRLNAVVPEMEQRTAEIFETLDKLRTSAPAEPIKPRKHIVPVLYIWLGAAFLTLILVMWLRLQWYVPVAAVLAFFIGWYRGLRTGIFTTMDWQINREEMDETARAEMDAIFEERARRKPPRSVYEETRAEIAKHHDRGVT